MSNSDLWPAILWPAGACAATVLLSGVISLPAALLAGFLGAGALQTVWLAVLGGSLGKAFSIVDDVEGREWPGFAALGFGGGGFLASWFQDGAAPGVAGMALAGLCGAAGLGFGPVRGTMTRVLVGAVSGAGMAVLPFRPMSFASR